MILLIDNYDSFTYNLFHYLGELGADVKVYLNDKITLDEIEALEPEKIVVSPGPCTPKEAGISCDAIKRFAARIPILGVCLGHQAIGAAFGGRIVRAAAIMHGKLSDVTHDSQSIFRNVKNPFSAMRYHSLVIDPASLPPELLAEHRERTLRIPMREQVRSLNLSATAAAAMYEAVRQIGPPLA